MDRKLEREIQEKFRDFQRNQKNSSMQAFSKQKLKTERINKTVPNAVKFESPMLEEPNEEEDLEDSMSNHDET